MEMKHLLVVVSVLALAGLAYFAYGTGKAVLQSVPSGGTPITAAMQDPTTAPSSSSVREVRVETFQFGFDPATITVKQGERIKLVTTSRDVPHSIAIPDYGIDLRSEPGKESSVEFTANKPGTFTFLCAVFCGSGHRGMNGQLVVQ